MLRALTISEIIMGDNEFLGSVETEGVANERGKDSEIPHEICIKNQEQREDSVRRTGRGRRLLVTMPYCQAFFTSHQLSVTELQSFDHRERGH